MSSSSSSSLSALASFSATLLSSSSSVAERTRAVFQLKSCNNKEAIDLLVKGLYVDSVLIAHEVGYALGQMGNEYALSHLTTALRDKTLHPIIRHECAEAIAAIGSLSCLSVIEEFVNDTATEVADTCKIARDRLIFMRDHKDDAELKSIDNRHFVSVDPAPALPLPVTVTSSTISSLTDRLCDSSLSLFERYRAMFALRNANTPEAVHGLGKALISDKTSAVFRHEIAYVFGQMQHPQSEAYLAKTLLLSDEHAMVRHEACEALGSLSSSSGEEVIRAHQQDKDDIVRESAVVALDISEYWQTDNDFAEAPITK